MKSGAVVYAKDLPRMELFYRACFDMDAIDVAQEYAVLESETLMLSLVGVPGHLRDAIEVSEPPSRRANNPIKLAFPVASIEGHRQVIADHGGLLDPPTTHWHFRDILHCDGIDPEGNVIQLLQDVPRAIHPAP